MCRPQGLSSLEVVPQRQLEVTRERTARLSPRALIDKCASKVIGADSEALKLEKIQPTDVVDVSKMKNDTYDIENNYTASGCNFDNSVKISLHPLIDRSSILAGGIDGINPNLSGL
jgi:hypothetical protein